MVCDEVNTRGGLVHQRALRHRLQVWSRKYFSGAAMLPKRVGLPRTRPSQAARSSRLAQGAPWSGTARCGRSLSAETGGTLRSLAVAPATDSMPRHTWRASCATLPVRE